MTAVEWLENKLNEEEIIIYHGLFDMWIKQAKEMEKQEMLEFGSKVTERWGMCKVEPHFIKDEFDKFFKSK